MDDANNLVNEDRRKLLHMAAGTPLLMIPGGAALAATQARDAVRTAITKGHEESVSRLREWIALPSIAAEDRNMAQGAEYMAKLARAAGFQKAEVVPTSGQPGVFATLDVGAKATLGLYFMYDVKQYDPAEWSSPPLEGRIVDKPGLGKVMVGRGAVNQKGPQAAFLAALHALRLAGQRSPVNLVLVAEGEEEIGSPHFSEIATRPDILSALHKCTGIIIPTASQTPGTGAVTLFLGAKGVLEIELVSSGEKWGRGPKGDIHSSTKPIVDSPAWHLVTALATLVTPDGNTPVIDGLMDKIRPLTPREHALIAESTAGMSEVQVKKMIGVDRWVDDMSWAQAQERLAAMPTINIEGLVSGHTGPGGKTILPGRAVAKLDMRLVPDMTVEDTVAKLRAHLAKRGYGDIEVNVSGGYGPTETAENSALIRAERATLAQFGIPASMAVRNPGSWPGVVFTGQPVNLPAGQFGLGFGAGAHSPNEFFVIESSDPKIMGLDDSAFAFVEFMHQVAAVSRR